LGKDVPSNNRYSDGPRQPSQTYAVQIKNNLTDPQLQTLPATISFIGNDGERHGASEPAEPVLPGDRDTVKLF
jgi:hypothetical protein